MWTQFCFDTFEIPATIGFRPRVAYGTYSIFRRRGCDRVRVGPVMVGNDWEGAELGAGVTGLNGIY